LFKAGGKYNVLIPYIVELAKLNATQPLGVLPQPNLYESTTKSKSFQYPPQHATSKQKESTAQFPVEVPMNHCTFLLAEESACAWASQVW